MADFGVYTNLTELKATVNNPTGKDTELLDALHDVSRFIDGHCHRHFYVKTATRTFSARGGDYLLLPYDLLSVTTLKTDDDDDWDYDYTWATTDYHLYPFNEWPKWKLLTKSGGLYVFPRQEEGVQLAGLWGYGDGESATPYTASGATVTVADATTTTVTVSDQALLRVGQTILVGSEQMFIIALTNAVAPATDSATVERAVNGTTGAAHAAAAASVYRYPRNIRRACLFLAQQVWRSEGAPFGVVGSGEGSTIEAVAQQYPKVLHWLAPFRRLEVA